VLIQTALIADEFEPVASEPALRDSYMTVLSHRRGYAGSSPAWGPGSISGDAVDCRRLLAELGIDRAHVVGCPTAVLSRCSWLLMLPDACTACA
jgi:hypothetical protein